MITGRRFTAAEALTAGIAGEAGVEAEVLPKATALAASLAGKDGAVVARIRKGLYGPAIEALNGPVF
jgi:enoyl-CoA hydratase/carnithine racemase